MHAVRNQTVVLDGPTKEHLYKTMRVIRRFEERVVELVNSDEIAGVTHEYIGQEAVATGVCAALRTDDVITSTHRGHGHVIAKGGDPARMMAELMGRTTGYNRGRGGSMHIADVSLGIYGANGIVGAGVPFAAGAAWAARHSGSDRLAVAFFGDGALNQGVLLETFNLASVWSLPVLFICENNHYAVTMAISASTAGDPVTRAKSFDMRARSVDGMDVEAVALAAGEEVALIRGGGGPAFLECQTYRFVGHHTAERTMKLTYRTAEEVASWVAKDPLRMEAERIGSKAADRIDGEVELELERAIEFARQAPVPAPETALEDMYANPMAGLPAKGWSDA
ncbi:MAG: thiamine pyrophosphate-dependent dehydrogenase E1 component subunit alpha [Candidatus Dormibacteraceae bacterium]